MSRHGRKKTRGTQIRKELVDAVETFINEHPEAGYKSIAEFCADAVRHLIEELRERYPAKQKDEVQ